MSSTKVSVVARLPLLGFVALWSIIGNAQPNQPMSFSVFWPCAGNASFCALRILAEGNIEANSAEKLTAFLNDAKSSKDSLPPTPVICFNSLGGDIRGAIRLGQLIRDLNLDTCTEQYYDRVIPGTHGEQETFVKDAVCASACIFALAGGVNRFVERASRIGVHQFYSANGNIGDGSTQTIVVALANYLEHMGIDRSLLDIASLVPPQDVLWLTPEQLQKFRVDNIVTVTTPWTLEAFKDGSVYAHIVQVKPVIRGRVSLLVRRVYDQIFLYAGFTPEHSEPDDIESALDALSGEAIEVWIDTKRVGYFESVQWRISKNTIIASLPLSSSAAEHFRLGRTLEVRVSLPTA